MFNELPLKEKTAIELRYVGNKHQDIADKIGLAKETIDHWFDEKGKLKQDYDSYVKEMNEKRKQEAIKRYVESDENILTITTNILRQVGKDLGDGKLELSVADFKKAWEIQRIMLGLPTDVKRQDMSFDQEEIDKEAQRLRSLIEGKDINE